MTGLSLREAQLRLVDVVAGPVEDVDLPLSRALGHVLAASVVARRAEPICDRSAVDGYALRTHDVAFERRSLRLKGQALAGHEGDVTVAAGECVRVATGSRLPQGADAVAFQESVADLGSHITVEPGLAPFANVRKAGEEFAAGQCLVTEGSVVTPSVLALAAALDVKRLRVRRRVRCAVLSSGDELRRPGQAGAQAMAPVDSNRVWLRAELRQLECRVIDAGVIPDRLDAVCERLQALDDVDLIVSTGGVSVGPHDFMPDAVRRLQGSFIFQRALFRPGTPAFAARLGSTVWLALPGNPLAAHVTLDMFARPWLTRLQGRRSPLLEHLRIPLGHTFQGPSGPMTRLVPALLESDTRGRMHVHMQYRSSASVLGCVGIAGYVEVQPQSESLRQGEEVSFWHRRSAT